MTQKTKCFQNHIYIDIYYYLNRNNQFLNYIEYFLNKTGCSRMDFDVISPIQSSEFIKSVNYGNNLKKKNMQKKAYNF